MNGEDEKRRPLLRLVASKPARRAGPGAGGEDLDALAAAAIGGDREALRDVVTGHGALVLAIVRRYARTPQDASDLVHRTFVRAFRIARRTLRRDPERSLAFRRSLVRAALAAARIQLRREVHLARTRLDQLGPADPQASSGPSARLAAERAARARAAVLRLSRREREVLTLALDAEIRIAEIAEVLGITVHAAKENLGRAALLLRGAPGPAPVAPCPELVSSLPARVLGALERAESLRVDGHVAGCRACSAEASGFADALAVASLAPPSGAERQALEEVPARVLAALRGRRAAQMLRAFTLAAVGATLALALALLRHP